MSEEASLEVGAAWGSPPPAEIGALVRTVDIGEGTVSFALQFQRTAFLVLLSAMVGFLISIIPAALLVWVLTDWIGVERETARFIAKGLAAVVSLGAAALAAPLAWGENAPASRTHIGREGVARFDRRSDRAGVGPSALMRFEDVWHLVITGRVNVESNPSDPTRVHFDYQWIGFSGAILFRLRGVYECEASGVRNWFGNRKEIDLAEEIEQAWNDFQLRRAREALDAGDVVELVRDVNNRSRRARIGRGFVEMIDGARVERWEAQDIDSLALSGGAVTILRRDPLRGKDQEHRYPGGEMENESFFPLALREIVGVRVKR
jgi:hypothetical protein